MIHLAAENISRTENVSRVAADELESNRLACYTEKSGRHQLTARDLYHVPQELTPAQTSRFTETVERLERREPARENETVIMLQSSGCVPLFEKRVCHPRLAGGHQRCGQSLGFGFVISNSKMSQNLQVGIEPPR